MAIRLPLVLDHANSNEMGSINSIMRKTRRVYEILLTNTTVNWSELLGIWSNVLLLGWQ